MEHQFLHLIIGWGKNRTGFRDFPYYGKITKWKYCPRKNGSTIPGKIKIKKGKIGPVLERSPAISADVFSGNSTSKMRLTFRLAATFGLAVTFGLSIE
jgi:hypothetical protein